LFLNLETFSKRTVQQIALLLVFFTPSLLAAAGNVNVRDIHYWSGSDYTRVVIDLWESVEFSKNRLTKPERLYFDIQNSTISKEIKTNLPVGDGILKSIRASQFNPTTVRVVLDLEEISDFNTFLIDNPSRMVIDVYGKGKKTEKSERASAKRRIVIDPGHGGHDPGAIGPDGLYEKDVVLDIALRLRKILAADPSNEVFLTRDRDVFIPLEERTAIANRKNADLFVSIHANASPRRHTRGIETYLLNWTDDEEANRVAARENQISLKQMKEMNRKMDVVDVIKNDLLRENKRDESIKLANYIQRRMVSGLADDQRSERDLGVKQALFYVLFGARMPSVLVEVSFISNPVEEHLLSQDSYRTEIAKAIAEGLDTYISSAPVIQKVEFRSKNSD
jgi:N-acetylmuramoyl-L-alanine amidase